MRIEGIREMWIPSNSPGIHRQAAHLFIFSKIFLFVSAVVEVGGTSHVSIVKLKDKKNSLLHFHQDDKPVHPNANTIIDSIVKFKVMQQSVVHVYT